MLLFSTVLFACSAEKAELSANDVVNEIRDELATAERGFEGEPQTIGRSIQAGGLTRTFLVTVPPGIDEREDVPLIFVFHGYHGNAETMRSVTRFDNANAVVVYLDGIGNAWAPAPYAKTTGSQDIAFFEAVREAMIAEFPISPASVFLTGLSNGGGFAAYAACRRPHQVTGIATVSAAYYDDVYHGCSPIPVKQIDFHGTADDTIHYQGGVRYEEPYEAVEDVMSAAARKNHCDPDPAANAIDRRGEELVWQRCDAQLRHYRMDGGLHLWPGSPQDGKSATGAADGFASREILDFFGVTYRGQLGPTDPH